MLIIPEKRVEIKSGADVVMLIRKSLKSRHDAVGEHIWSIGLNSQNETLYVDKISSGRRLNEATANPRRLFGMAMCKGATAVILCHKRLSDDPKPSREDINLTRRLSHGGDLLCIKVLDHVILGNTGHFSFREYGMKKLLYETKSIRKFS